VNDNIRNEIKLFTTGYQNERHTETIWRTPLVGFASALDPLFETLKEAVTPTHAMPKDLLPDAHTVVAFFVPFEESTIRSNVEGEMSSRNWAQAYLETNGLIVELGAYMKRYLESLGHAVTVTPPTHNFDPGVLISDWSHRHVAFVAGLGTFGLNNMLITHSGCCGRIGSFVTSANMAPDLRPETDACLYHYNASCIKCVKRCVNDALFVDRFDRHKCYEMCLRNEEIFRFLGRADVCGKCLVGVPCSSMNPVSKLYQDAEQDA